MSWSCSGLYSGAAASCSATVTPASACYAPATAPVSWWKGDDDATDHMGNNNGTLENGASFALGGVNDAFSFNGSNQYVLIGQPVPADLQIQNNFTLSAWIYVTSYPANVGSGPWQYIFGSEGPNGGIGLFLAGPVSGSSAGSLPPCATISTAPVQVLLIGTANTKCSSLLACWSKLSAKPLLSS